MSFPEGDMARAGYDFQSLTLENRERMVGPRYLDMSRLDDNLVEAD